MPTDGHSGFLKTGGSHIGAGRLFWYWGKAQRRVRAAQVQTNSKRAARQCEPRRLFAPRKALCFFRKKACPWVFSPTRPEGDWGRAESPQCARRRKPLSPVRLDAPTSARIGTGRPMGRSHFSFGGERKVCKRKPAARRLREKGFYCPFWRRGSLCRAQRSWPAYACNRARSELAFFRRQNGRAFFPPLPIAALLPRSWRLASAPLAG